MRRRTPARRLLLLGLLGLLAGCTALPFSLQPRISVDGQPFEAAGSDPYQQGKAHLRDGRIALALQSFRAELAGHPHSVRTLNAMAVSYEQLGRADVATRYYERALVIDPSSAQTLNNLGYSSLRRGELAQAIGYFERALGTSQPHPTIEANLQLAGLQQDRAGAVAVDYAEQRAEVRIVPAAWVERTNSVVQTIVTRPDPAVLAASTRFGVDPQLFNVHFR